jgi:hypothetical protein
MKILLLLIVLILAAVTWFQYKNTALVTSTPTPETVYSQPASVATELTDGSSNALSWCSDTAVDGLRVIINTFDSEQYEPGTDEKATAILKPIACVLLVILAFCLPVSLIRSR